MKPSNLYPLNNIRTYPLTDLNLWAQVSALNSRYQHANKHTVIKLIYMMHRQIVLEIWNKTGSTTYLVQKRFIPADHSFFFSFFSFVCSPPFCFVRFEELCSDSLEVVLVVMTLFDMVRVSEINLNEKINLPISPLKFLYYMIFFFCWWFSWWESFL